MFAYSHAKQQVARLRTVLHQNMQPPTTISTFSRFSSADFNYILTSSLTNINRQRKILEVSLLKSRYGSEGHERLGTLLTPSTPGDCSFLRGYQFISVSRTDPGANVSLPPFCWPGLMTLTILMTLVCI